MKDIMKIDENCNAIIVPSGKDVKDMDNIGYFKLDIG